MNAKIKATKIPITLKVSKEKIFRLKKSKSKAENRKAKTISPA